MDFRMISTNKHNSANTITSIRVIRSKISVILFTLLFVFLCNLLFAQPRTKYNFNSDWKVFKGDDKEASSVGFNDGPWKKVTLPYGRNQSLLISLDLADDAAPADIPDFRSLL